MKTEELKNTTTADEFAEYLENEKNLELEKKLTLPTDAEVEKWYDLNISEMDECSASSAIYKFRLWLKDRSK